MPVPVTTKTSILNACPSDYKDIHPLCLSRWLQRHPSFMPVPVTVQRHPSFMSASVTIQRHPSFMPAAVVLNMIVFKSSYKWAADSGRGQIVFYPNPYASIINQYTPMTCMANTNLLDMMTGKPESCTLLLLFIKLCYVSNSSIPTELIKADWGLLSFNNKTNV